MAYVKTFALPCSDQEKYVSLSLFVGVKNASKLRSKITSGGLEGALLDATLLVSPFHILSAVMKAVMNSEQGQIRTKNIYSEIIYSLSPSTNISDAFKKFGIRDSSMNVVLAVIHPAMDTTQVEDIAKFIVAEQVPLVQLAAIHDEEAIKKVYKILPEEIAISSLESSVVTRMAVRDVT